MCGNLIQFSLTTLLNNLFFWRTPACLKNNSHTPVQCTYSKWMKASLSAGESGLKGDEVAVRLSLRESCSTHVWRRHGRYMQSCVFVVSVLSLQATPLRWDLTTPPLSKLLWLINAFFALLSSKNTWIIIIGFQSNDGQHLKTILSADCDYAYVQYMRVCMRGWT